MPTFPLSSSPFENPFCARAGASLCVPKKVSLPFSPRAREGAYLISCCHHYARVRHVLYSTFPTLAFLLTFSYTWGKAPWQLYLFLISSYKVRSNIWRNSSSLI